MKNKAYRTSISLTTIGLIIYQSSIHRAMCPPSHSREIMDHLDFIEWHQLHQLENQSHRQRPMYHVDAVSVALFVYCF